MNSRRAVGSLLRSIRLRRPARRVYRTVLGSALDILWAARNGSRPAPDGIPYPPPALCYRTAASYDPYHFLKSGETGAAAIRSLLADHGLQMDGMERVLDLGCGCGRLARHFGDLTHAELHGVDIDPRQVRWCAGNLPFGRFTCNRLESELDYPDGTFDLALAVAVFGHMNMEHHNHWMRELGRVLRRGGHLILTAKGGDRLHELSPEQAAEFMDGRPVVVEPCSSGSNYCLAYHPEGFVRDSAAGLAGCEAVYFAPSGSPDTRQDLYLLRKEP